MLKRAQEEEIVHTRILSPSGTHVELENGLREAFGISEAIVVECTEDRADAVMARIGEAAAHFLEATLQSGEVIGVSSWSETVLKMVDNIHPLKDGKATQVVQTLGGIGDPTVQIHANQLTTRLAKLTGADASVLNAPGIVQSKEAKLVLLADPFVRETIDLFDKVSLAIVGIGAIEPSRMLARSGNVFTSQELSKLEKAGGVGDMGLRFFDIEGRPVRAPLDERVIGMTLGELTQIDRVIALAGGKAKTAAIRGALRTGAIDILVTDKFTAGRLTSSGNGKRVEK